MPPRKPTSPTPIPSHTHADKQPNILTEELHGFGRWAFIEIVEPWDAKNTIRGVLKA